MTTLAIEVRVSIVFPFRVVHSAQFIAHHSFTTFHYMHHVGITKSDQGPIDS